MSVRQLTRPDTEPALGLAARAIDATKVYGSGDLAVREVQLFRC